MKGTQERPASAMGNSVGMEPAELEQEMHERDVAVEKAKLEADNRAKKNPIAQAIGSYWFVTDCTFGFLVDETTGYNLRVSYFFPEKQICVDTYEHAPTMEENRQIGIKRELLKANGKKYVCLDPSKNVSDIPLQLRSA